MSNYLFILSVHIHLSIALDKQVHDIEFQAQHIRHYMDNWKQLAHARLTSHKY